MPQTLLVQIETIFSANRSHDLLKYPQLREVAQFSVKGEIPVNENRILFTTTGLGEGM